MILSLNKTNSTLDRYNNVSTRKFKQLEEKSHLFEKITENRVQQLESTVATSVKSMKDVINNTISHFEERLKAFEVENQVLRRKIKDIDTGIKAMESNINDKHQELFNNMTENSNSLDLKLTQRIDNLIENNLKIPGVIEDPENINPDSKTSNTLKDYILENIENNRNHVVNTRVNFSQNNL